ncbi:MAG: VOC family protein [Sphingobacteriales bacterium]|nr:MAG: VOC family protein [Sphingobacteriales bacterium]
MNQDIYPCLWCNNNAEEVAAFYAEALQAKITTSNAVVVNIEVAGDRIMLLNGGAQFTKNPSVSLMLICHSTEELHQYWDALVKEGVPLMPLNAYPFADLYGWVRDKYGMTWQLYFKAGYTAEQRITPTLMFINKNNGKAKEAINLYTSIFADSGIDGIMYYRDGEGGDEPDHIQHAEFRIKNYKIACMDSSLDHRFDFNEGISMVAMTQNQEETDHLWNHLIANGGSESRCGWLKDKFGLSWQIVPKRLAELIGDQENRAKSKAAMNAMLQMNKIVIADLEAAYNKA